MSRLTWLLVLFTVAICLVQVVAAAADDDEDLLKGTADAAAPEKSSGPIAVKATLENVAG